ncbi:hypothetical protein [Actinomadura rudentiformis]|uniref:Uncharacterized protein n=1 Tax=Actinomadura rudentiformis TaxID=359158 RepID=A0A6H9YJN7_9ACTN|nr:hypothetical protein [Actinomadura rudentiformis]KAB2344487.1 hypothetical protein F8566_31675 [Actinomadura rudentiformis]
MSMYQVLPFEGLAEARLGEERAVLQRRLGEHRTFRKGHAQIGLADQYVERGLILHHDDRERLFYIEVSDVPLYHRDVPLLDRPYESVRNDLAELGCRIVEDDEGCELPDDGFNLWCVDTDVTMVGLFPKDRRGSVGDFVEGESRVGTLRAHDVTPGVGTGPVRLGMRRDELRAMLGTCLESVPEYGAAGEDSYIEHGLTLEFAADDVLTGIVIASLARTVTCQGVQMLGRRYSEVVDELAAAGVTVERGELAGHAPGFTLQCPSEAWIVSAIRIGPMS